VTDSERSGTPKGRKRGKPGRERIIPEKSGHR
jgi:hypothetical protein